MTALDGVLRLAQSQAPVVSLSAILGEECFRACLRTSSGPSHGGRGWRDEASSRPGRRRGLGDGDGWVVVGTSTVFLLPFTQAAAAIGCGMPAQSARVSRMIQLRVQVCP